MGNDNEYVSQRPQKTIRKGLKITNFVNPAYRPCSAEAATRRRCRQALCPGVFVAKIFGFDIKIVITIYNIQN